MRKNILILNLILIMLFSLTGCTTKENPYEPQEIESIEDKLPQKGPGPIDNIEDIDKDMLIEKVPNVDPNFVIEVDTTGIDDGIIMN